MRATNFFWFFVFFHTGDFFMGNFVELKSADGFVFPAYVAQAEGASSVG